MSDDRQQRVSAVDIAGAYIAEAGDEWSLGELADVLTRAGISLGDGAELEEILEAVQERIEYTNTLSEAVAFFLRQNAFRDLAHAAGEMDCTAEEVADFIAARVKLVRPV